MPKQVDYWDSQAAAAADLKIDIYEIRDAKRAGCRAFRSGRVYKPELRAWIAAKHASKESIDLDSDEIPAAPDWNDRQMALFRVLWCPYDAYFDDRIDLKSFIKIGRKTLEYVLRLARAWQLDLESGLRESWQDSLNEAQGERDRTRRT